MGTNNFLKISISLAILLILGSLSHPCILKASQQHEEKPFYSLAVIDFEAKDKDLKELGSQTGALLTAFLSANDNLIMVERQEIEKIMGEQALGLSGTVQQDTAAKIGQITGAKIIITGRVMHVGNEVTLIAKIIGTETSRVYAVTFSMNQDDSPTSGCQTLAEKISEKISQNGSTLIAKVETRQDYIDRLKKEVSNKKLPTVTVKIGERHVDRNTIDPAAETELSSILQQLGFNILDYEKSTQKPDIEITGEAFSESGAPKGEMAISKGRVEIKAVDLNNGNILTIDRQTEVAVDIGDQIAGKTAIQKATMNLAERVVKKIVK